MEDIVIILIFTDMSAKLFMSSKFIDKDIKINWCTNFSRHKFYIFVRC